jgi:hypothetical protein
MLHTPSRSPPRRLRCSTTPHRSTLARRGGTEDVRAASVALLLRRQPPLRLGLRPRARVFVRPSRPRVVRDAGDDVIRNRRDRIRAKRRVREHGLHPRRLPRHERRPPPRRRRLRPVPHPSPPARRRDVRERHRQRPDVHRRPSPAFLPYFLHLRLRRHANLCPDRARRARPPSVVPRAPSVAVGRRDSRPRTHSLKISRAASPCADATARPSSPSSSSSSSSSPPPVRLASRRRRPVPPRPRARAADRARAPPCVGALA